MKKKESLKFQKIKLLQNQKIKQSTKQTSQQAHHHRDLTVEIERQSERHLA